MKKNVVFVTKHFPPKKGGAAKSAYKISSLIREFNAGQTYVVCIRESENVVYDLEENVKMAEGLIEVNISPGERGLRELFQFLISFGKKNDIEVFHGHYLYPAGLMATRAAKFLGKKSIVSIRGNDVGRDAFNPKRYPFLQETLNSADHITSVSRDLMDFAEKIICQRSLSTQLIPNSIDHNSNSWVYVPSAVLRVLCIGLFKYKKGAVQLAKAINSLVLEGEKIELTLVGDFEDPDERAYIEKKYGANGFVNYIGYLNKESLDEKMLKSDVLFCPSLFSEGCPNVVLEAVSIGLPIVVGPYGGGSEIVSNYSRGFVMSDVTNDEIRNLLKYFLNQQNDFCGRALCVSTDLQASAEKQRWQQAYRKLEWQEC